MEKELRRLIFVNRQPSLWRHSCPVLKIKPIEDDDNETIQLNPLAIEPLNADHDGDTIALYAVHDTDALREMEEKAFLLNNLYYDQNNSFLAVLRHEALYTVFILTRTEFDKDNIVTDISELQYLPESLELWNDHLYSAVIFKNNIYSYGIALLNKWCGFDDILINESITKKNVEKISKTIYEFFKDSKKYYDVLADLERKLFSFITITKHCPSLDVMEMINIKDENSKKLLDKLPNNHILLGYYINEAITKRCIQNLNKESVLYKLFKSGSRFTESQLARSCISIGYSADANNVIISQPISSSLLEGLTQEEYFRVSSGTRKSIKDKANITPMSGYMERTLVMALSPIQITMEDCGTETYLEIIVSSLKHAETLVGKYYRYSETEDWKILTNEDVNSIIEAKIQIRSAITCIAPNFKLCKKCFGIREFPTKYIGITAGQNLTERITQLILRTFHESGRATIDINAKIRKFFTDHLVNIEYDEKENIILEFDTDKFPELLIEDKIISGLYDVEKNKLKFKPDTSLVENKDIVYILDGIRSMLSQDTNVSAHPKDYYVKLMSLLLEVGTVYSSFVEMLFCNMFLVDDPKDKKFWRYNQHLKPTYKLSDKSLAVYINPLLGLLYQPNKKTIDLINNEENMNLDQHDLTIYEKIWLNKV